MKTKILLAGLVCLSVAAVAQQSNSDQKTTPKSNQVMVRESPTKASTGLRESPTTSKPTMVRESPTKSSLSVADADGDGKADRNIGSQSSSNGAGVAINNSHSNIKSPRDLATGQASGKVSSEGADQAPAVRESPTKASTCLRESPSKSSLGKSASAADASSGLRESPSKASTGKTAVVPPAGTNAGGQANRESSAASVSEVVVTKPSEKGRVATGDVNGDGTADAASGPRQSTPQNAAVNTSHSNIKNGKDAATGQATGRRQYEPVKLQKGTPPASPKQ